VVHLSRAGAEQVSGIHLRLFWGILGVDGSCDASRTFNAEYQIIRFLALAQEVGISSSPADVLGLKTVQAHREIVQDIQDTGTCIDADGVVTPVTHSRAQIPFFLIPNADAALRVCAAGADLDDLWFGETFCRFREIFPGFRGWYKEFSAESVLGTYLFEAAVLGIAGA